MNQTPKPSQQRRPEDPYGCSGKGTMPVPLKTKIAALYSAIEMHRKMVGVKFFFDRREFERSSLRTVRSRMSFCMMVKIASKGTGLIVTDKNFKCPGARRALGIENVDQPFCSGEKYFGLGLYKDLDTAKSVAQEMLFLDRKPSAMAVAPIDQLETLPDTVILITDGYSAMRILQGYTYHYGQARQIRLCGNQGVCCELTSKPFMAQDMNISLLCSNTRFSCKWQDKEIGIGLPYHQLGAVVDGLLKTLNATEPDWRKQEIIKRANAQGLELGVVLGKNYYN